MLKDFSVCRYIPKWKYSVIVRSRKNSRKFENLTKTMLVAVLRSRFKLYYDSRASEKKKKTLIHQHFNLKTGRWWYDRTRKAEFTDVSSKTLTSIIPFLFLLGHMEYGYVTNWRHSESCTGWNKQRRPCLFQTLTFPWAYKHFTSTT